MPEMRVENIALDYEGEWNSIPSADASIGSRHETNDAADHDAAARWSGAFRSAKVFASTGDYGLAEIWLDGKRLQVIDLYSSSERHGVPICTIDNLEAEFHTLEIRKSGRKNKCSSSCRLNLDYLELDFVKPSNVRYRQSSASAIRSPSAPTSKTDRSGYTGAGCKACLPFRSACTACPAPPFTRLQAYWMPSSRPVIRILSCGSPA